MKKQRYTYLNDGFEGVLYEAENKDDRDLRDWNCLRSTRSYFQGKGIQFLP